MDVLQNRGTHEDLSLHSGPYSDNWLAHMKAGRFLNVSVLTMKFWEISTEEMNDGYNLRWLYV